MKELTRIRGYTDQMVEDANAVIFTFGSYRLGVRKPFMNDAMKFVFCFLCLIFDVQFKPIDL